MLDQDDLDGEENVKQIEELTDRNMELIGSFIDHVREETGIDIPESVLISFFNG
jgi:hypothetical protein